MKKALSVFLLAVILTSVLSVTAAKAFADDSDAVWDGSIGTAFDGGAGTEDDPYLISSGKTLAYLAYLVNEVSADNGGGPQNGKYFRMTNSIDLGNREWTPIGKDYGGSFGNIAFNGNFDGGGYCIKNLNAITVSGAKTTGLFGLSYSGFIENLGIESGTVNVASTNGGGIIGVLQSVNSNSVGAKAVNCYNNATIKKSVVNSSQTFLGGIAGSTFGTFSEITDCINYGTIDASIAQLNGNSAYGGICGIANPCKISGCYNVGKIIAGVSNAGGIVGWGSNSATITDCASSGLVFGAQSGDRFGLITGKASLKNGAPAAEYTNVTAYILAYSEYTDGKITKNGTEYSLATDICGMDGREYVSGCTVNADETFVLPCAVGEKFLIATEYGEYVSETVGNGTPSAIDGIMDDAYLLSFRKIGYGKGTNSVADASWNDMSADIYVMADYRNIYMFVSVADGDVEAADKINIKIELGDSTTNISVASDGTLVCDDAEASGGIVKAVRTTENGWNTELAIPAGTVAYDRIGLGFTLVDGNAEFSETARDAVEEYRIRDIHGTPGVSVTGVELLPEILTLKTSDTYELKATVSPTDAYELGLEWSSSDTSVVSVSSLGVLKASKPGTATITVKTKDGGFTDTCAVTVDANTVSGVSLDITELTLTGGKKKLLICTVSPANADNKDVVWTSDNENVATVSQNGLVTAVAAGSADITVTSTDGGYTAVCRVTVVIPLSGIKLDRETLNMNTGEKTTLRVTAEPADATDTDFRWSSDDDGVVTVNASGEITAVGAGSATVTVSSADGKYSASCAVTVEAVTDGESDSETSSSKKGCKSSVSGVFFLTAGACLAVAVIQSVMKKKEN
ncbi:MAG: Ig domain-containing protein [Eubacteriales bacterium]